MATQRFPEDDFHGGQDPWVLRSWERPRVTCPYEAVKLLRTALYDIVSTYKVMPRNSTAVVVQRRKMTNGQNALNIVPSFMEKPPEIVSPMADPLLANAIVELMDAAKAVEQRSMPGLMDRGVLTHTTDLEALKLALRKLQWAIQNP